MSTFSDTEAKYASTSDEVSGRPFRRLTVSRLMSFGSSCPSTLATTRCWYERHAVNCDR